MKKYIFFIIISISFLSCSKKPSSYIPLKEGNTWEYEIAVNGSLVGKIKETIVGKEKIKGNEYYKMFTENSYDNTKTIEYARESNEGIVAIKEGSSTEMIELPGKISIGQEWEYLVFGEKGKAKITSFDDITINGKVYKDCLRVDWYASRRQNLNSEVYFYYAKDIGFITLHGEDKENNKVANITLTNFSE